MGMMRCLAFSLVCLSSLSLFAADAEVQVWQSPALPALPASPASIHAALTPILTIAASGDKNAPALVEQQLKSWLPKTGNDPRLHYAYALVLLKNFRHADATKEMQAASDHPLYYFPVHHFLIYEQVRQKQYDLAIDSLLDLSARLGDPGQLWTSEDDRLQAARWLGRMIAFLEGPCGNPEVARQMNREEAMIRSLVGPVYASEIDLGFNEVHAEHREMQLLLLAAVDTAVLKKADELKAAEQKQKEIDAAKKSLATSAREQEAIVEEQIRDTDSQLGAMEKQFEVLTKAQATLQSTIASVRLEIAQLPGYAQVVNAGPGFNGGIPTFSQPLTQNQINSAMAVKYQELDSYVLELQKNAAKQTDLLNKASVLMSSRRQLQSQGSSAEGKNQDTLRGMARWEQRLNTKKKKVIQITDRRTAAIRLRIPLVSSFDAFNPQEELTELQKTLSGGDAVVP